MPITIKLQGGLGNQMFQYALGRKLALLLHTDLKLDKTLYDNYPHHAYSLNPFFVIQNFVTPDEVASTLKYRRKPGKIWYLYNKIIANSKKYFTEKRFEFDPDVLALPDGAYIDGYWQTEKYFKDIEDTIRKDFTLRVPLTPESNQVLESIKSSNAISLHIRRGLYVTHPVFSAHHGSCSDEYFGTAIDYIAKRVSNPHFFIFSDDHEWTREHIKPPYPTTYIEHTSVQTDYEDIILMSNCKHHILANSTFSWWGAWLNPSHEKIVIGPADWFRGVRAKKYNTKDILPPSWIRL
jgi:hypothetical protein